MALNALAVAAALVSLATVVLWVRSDSNEVPVLASRHSGEIHHRLFLWRGVILYERCTGCRPMQLSDGEVGQFEPLSARRFAGIAFEQTAFVKMDGSFVKLPGTYGVTSAWSVSMWWPLLISAPFLFSAGRRFKRFLKSRKILEIGRCGSCGYDLRATPHRCPECGSVIG